MIIRCTVNKKEIKTEIEAKTTLRELLVNLGYITVRDSDDGEGFVGSDTVLVNNLPVYANLMLASEAQDSDIRTAESLAIGGKVNYVQQAMIDAGVVQSALLCSSSTFNGYWRTIVIPPVRRLQMFFQEYLSVMQVMNIII